MINPKSAIEIISLVKILGHQTRNPNSGEIFLSLISAITFSKHEKITVSIPKFLQIFEISLSEIVKIRAILFSKHRIWVSPRFSV